MRKSQTALKEKDLHPLALRPSALISEHGRAVPEAEYWEQYARFCGAGDFDYEWRNGYLEEKGMSNYLNILMYQWFVDVLRRFLEVFPIGKLLAVEMAFRLALPGVTAIRKPDLAVVLDTNPIPLRSFDSSYTGTYDLCVELISDDALRDIRRDTVEKKREYARAGVKEYYILDVRGVYMAFYRRNRRTGKYAPIPELADGIVESSVLRGFRFRVADLYQQPSLQAMADDPVYQAFMLPFYQAEKQRAAQLTAQLAEERARAECLAARLRELGIAVD